MSVFGVCDSDVSSLREQEDTPPTLPVIRGVPPRGHVDYHRIWDPPDFDSSGDAWRTQPDLGNDIERTDASSCHDSMTLAPFPSAA